jgi:thioredoxin 1
MNKLLCLTIILIIVAGLTFCSNQQGESQRPKTMADSGPGLSVEKNSDFSESVSSGMNTKKETDAEQTLTDKKAQITFIELGSVNCIPCKKMQPVMKAIEEKYGDQIKVIFYDVWTDNGKPYAKRYDIRLIPTQVFVDVSGNEIMRHEGFFPEEEIDTFLQSHGLKVQ